MTRERLESFDRPITLEPECYGDKRGSLINDFRNYLGILKAVHSGADLQASATAAGNRCEYACVGEACTTISAFGVVRGSLHHRPPPFNSFILFTPSISCLTPSTPIRVPDAARGYLGYVLSHLGDSQILPLMEAAVEARAELAPVLAGNRELLYLDLALEDQVGEEGGGGCVTLEEGA